MTFLALFVSLPAKASTGRMRVLRGLKALGCATLRDGVYLLPELPAHADALGGVAAEARAARGSAEVYRLSGTDATQEAALRALFDRGQEYIGVVAEARALEADLKALDRHFAGRRMRSLARRFDQVRNLDFFPGESQRQAMAVLDEVREAVSRHLAPGEPTPSQAAIARRDQADFRGRTWATLGNCGRNWGGSPRPWNSRPRSTPRMDGSWPAPATTRRSPWRPRTCASSAAGAPSRPTAASGSTPCPWPARTDPIY